MARIRGSSKWLESVVSNAMSRRSLASSVRRRSVMRPASISDTQRSEAITFRIDELIDPPGTRQKLGCGGRLPGAVRTGDHKKIRHAAIFSFEIRLLTPSLRPWRKTCSMKALRRIAKKSPKEPLEMLGRPLPNQSASHPRQYPQQPIHGTAPSHGGTELC